MCSYFNRVFVDKFPHTCSEIGGVLPLKKPAEFCLQYFLLWPEELTDLNNKPLLHQKKEDILPIAIAFPFHVCCERKMLLLAVEWWSSQAGYMILWRGREGWGGGGEERGQRVKIEWSGFQCWGIKLLWYCSSVSLIHIPRPACLLANSGLCSGFLTTVGLR